MNLTHICNVELDIRPNDLQKQRGENKRPVDVVLLHEAEEEEGDREGHGGHAHEQFVAHPVQDQPADDVDEDAVDDHGK